MSPAEFDSLPDNVFTKGLRYESIRGVLIVTPPSGNAEIDPNEEPSHLVWLYKENHIQGSIVDKVLFERTIFATPNRRRADRASWTGLGRVPDPKMDA